MVDKTDLSIWEVRNSQKHFVYSKIMMWVAVSASSSLCLPNIKPKTHYTFHASSTAASAWPTSAACPSPNGKSGLPHETHFTRRYSLRAGTTRRSSMLRAMRVSSPLPEMRVRESADLGELSSQTLM